MKLNADIWLQLSDAQATLSLRTYTHKNPSAVECFEFLWYVNGNLGKTSTCFMMLHQDVDIRTGFRCIAII